MSRHSFDPEVAAMVGLNAAVIYQNIVWWCEKNAANGSNIHEGKAWTYNSMKAFETLFPYLTAKQIRVALEGLENAGLIEAGNFNANAYDRTKWYCPVGHIHSPSRANGKALEGEPIPDSKPDSKPDTPLTPMGNDLFSAENPTDHQEKTPDKIETGFKEFWDEIWPAHKRKTGRVECEKVYRQACTGKHPKAKIVAPDDLNAAARRYIASVQDREYLKGPLPWLRLPGWEAFLGAPEKKPLSYAQRVMRDYGAGA